jgi:hypothetical protein
MQARARFFGRHMHGKHGGGFGGENGGAPAGGDAQ